MNSPAVRTAAVSAGALLPLGAGSAVRAQDAPPPAPTAAETAPAAPQADLAERHQTPEGKHKPYERPWNQWNTHSFTARLGFALLGDAVTYSKDDALRAQEAQMGELKPGFSVRMDRLILSGKIKFPHAWAYTIAVNYNGIDRPQGETPFGLNDLAVTIPAGSLGAVTIGKQKEFVGLEMIESSRALPAMERSAASTAFLPTRNDGIRLGNTFHQERMTYSLGWFNDWLSNGLSFSQSGSQVTGRVTGLPQYGDGGRHLIHLGGAFRYSQSKEGNLRYKARPEVNSAPYVIDTGNFAARHALSLLTEAALLRGPLLLQAETISTKVSGGSGDPWFGGYSLLASYFLTGDNRHYDRDGGFFGRAKIGREGSWEVGLRYSDTDLDGGAVQGGTFRRATGAVSWYAPKHWRFEVNVGYAALNRFDQTSHFGIYQGRIQFEL